MIPAQALTDIAAKDGRISFDLFRRRCSGCDALVQLAENVLDVSDACVGIVKLDPKVSDRDITMSAFTGRAEQHDLGGEGHGLLCEPLGGLL